MPDQRTHLQSFSDARLIEVVKNAKQFGYDDSIRALALEILDQRGISETDLQLTGNLTNYKFDRARELYNAHTFSSKVAFVAYFVLLVWAIISRFHLIDFYPRMNYSGFDLVTFLVGVGTMAKAFFDHLNFYKAIGKKVDVGDQLIYVLLGMPFYIVMFFFYRSRMKEELLMIP